MDIKREVLRFKLNEEKEIGKQNDEIEQRIEETLRQETLRLEIDKNTLTNSSARLFFAMI